jgi:hypothetical protein
VGRGVRIPKLSSLFRRKPKSRLRRILDGAALVLVGIFASLSFAPELLAWPYRAERGPITIYSEAPITADVDRVLAKSERLLSASPLHRPDLRRRLFLSQGGWRWTLLALQTRGAFAFRRPFNNALIFNRSDVSADRITNGRTLGGVRSLSGVIAHETTHVLVARKLGELQAMMLPTWKQEGYADHVARESSLTREQYRMISRGGNGHPAADYFEARLRVEEALAANGANVDALLAGP